MRFLVVSSGFPPDALGGAELSAYQCARWLLQEGHEVHVLTTAKAKSEEIHGDEINGMRTWRILWPRQYPTFNHEHQATLRKIVWHLQDHFDPANRRIVSMVVQKVKPEFINIHLVAGIGHNSLSAFNSLKNVPITYFLHDLGLACVRSSMYVKGKSCEKKCLMCHGSSLVKFKYIKDDAIYNFVSPSASNLETLKRFTPIWRFRSNVVPNFDFETPILREPAPAGEPTRFIYVGRLHETKGVDFLLEVFKKVADEGHPLAVRIVGGGPTESKLRATYACESWVSFTGRLSTDLVKSEIASSDVICVPSVWRENHPGVVRQALRAGVPALVSDLGGSAEMIEDGKSGFILPASNHEAWSSAITRLIQRPEVTSNLQAGALKSAEKYSVRVVGDELRPIIARALVEASRQSRVSNDTKS